MTPFRTVIKPNQQWQGQMIHFDPDASPEAWAHYQIYYADSFWDDYTIASPTFFTNVFNVKIPKVTRGEWNEQTGKWYNYVNHHGVRNNRLFAISMPDDVVISKTNGKTFYSARLRLSGETDFNFNMRQFHFLNSLLLMDEGKVERDEYLSLLKKCSEMHHTLANFSLMQSMGNLQRFKGSRCNDRLDQFIYYLHTYYETDENERGNREIATNASDANRPYLQSYLNRFKDIYDYCEKVYFISDKKFVERLIENGALPIRTANDGIRYMQLAITFWEKKEMYFHRSTICSSCN